MFQNVRNKKKYLKTISIMFSIELLTTKVNAYIYTYIYYVC
jgi:hypothetical protein